MRWMQNKCGKVRNNCKIAAEDQFIYTPPRKERPGMRKIPGHTYFEREVSATVFVIYTPHQEEVDQLLPESDPYKHLAAAFFKTYFDKDGNVRMDTDMCQSPNTAPKHQKKRKEKIQDAEILLRQMNDTKNTDPKNQISRRRHKKSEGRRQAPKNFQDAEKYRLHSFAVMPF